MNTLPNAQYRDPLEYLLREEEKSCKGCRRRRMIDGALQCTNPRTKDPLTDVRCNDYEERE